MPADRIKQTKVFEKKFEYQIMDKKNAIRSQSVLNQSTVKVYTDGSELHRGAISASPVAKRAALPFHLIGTTDARVACSFVFTRPFSN